MSGLWVTSLLAYCAAARNQEKHTIGGASIGR